MLAERKLDDDVDDALNMFNDSIKLAANCMIKRINTSGTWKNAIWYDNECKEAKVECRKKLKCFRNIRNEESRKVYVESRKQYKRIIKLKKQRHRKSVADSLTNNINNSGVFWKELKQLGGCKKSTISENITLEDWYKHFENVFKQCEVAENNHNYINDPEEESDHTLNSVITEEEVKWAVAKLNTVKQGELTGLYQKC